VQIRSETTAREESINDRRPSRLSLCWVWPSQRSDLLQGAKLVIGRDEEADLRIQGSGVSRQHAELYRQGPLYAIRDLGSTNGTWLDGRRIEHAPVSPGQVLRVGDWLGVFELRSETAVGFEEHGPGVFGGAEIAELLAPLKRAAPTNLPILLIGDTGTGKERFARATHQFSERKGPFVAVNCAALPEQLAEAELFGYRRGAFTGDERANPGHFRAANGGTLFLDEMPELSLALQAKLLRVVEDGVVLGLGESTPTVVDVRIVSASQKPLAELVRRGRLREDLAARLSGLQVRIPPLAGRRADIAPMFRQFLKQQTGGRAPAVETRLVEALCLHDWPQNVRELELLTRTLLAVHGHEATLRRQHLPTELAARVEPLSPSTQAPQAPRDRRAHDLSLLKQELASNGGNVKSAAEALGISRQRIYRLLESDEEVKAGAASPSDDSGNDHERRD
jgi:DNA-binding NtrC family response regulator